MEAPKPQLALADEFARVPPQNLDAEESVLGAMMLTQQAIAAVSEHVTAGDFYRHSHGTIFRVAIELYGRGEPVDAITLTEELDRQGLLADVGGQAKLHELAALVPAWSNAAHYAKIVRESATLRGLIDAGSRIAELGWERHGEAAGLVEQAQRLVTQLAQARTAGEFADFSAALSRLWERTTALQGQGGGIPGLPCGIAPIDELCRGFRPGQMIVIAGRPSMGKSALAHTIIAHVVLELELPVCLFTLEMTADEVALRLAAAEAGIDSTLIDSGALGGDELLRLTRALDRLQQAAARLRIYDKSFASPAEIRAKARLLKTQLPELALVVVDYLQLAADGKPSELVFEVGRVSRQLKQLAGELEVPVVALSQLSRAVEQRPDKRPELSDLKMSGEIEQDADIVMLLYRAGQYRPHLDQAVTEVNVAKQRNGPTGTATIRFDRQTARFGDDG